MTAALPVSEVVDLFNEVLGDHASTDDLVASPDALGRIVWRVRSLLRQRPGDFVLRTTLGGALLLTGDRSGAAAELETAAKLRDRRVVPVQCSLAMLYAMLGDLARSGSLIEEVIADPALRRQPPALNNAAHLAFLAGDVERLQAISAFARQAAVIDVAALHLAMIESAGLPEHLSVHQKLVFDAVAPFQCWIDIEFDATDGLTPMVAVFSRLVLDDAGCRRLDRRLFETLSDHYEPRTASTAPYVGCLNWNLVPILSSEGERLAV